MSTHRYVLFHVEMFWRLGGTSLAVTTEPTRLPPAGVWSKIEVRIATF